MENVKNGAQQPQGGAVAKIENVGEQVLAKITQLEQQGDLKLPANYSAENQLKAAWLVLQETEDKDHHKALDVCTKGSIANAMLDMVLQGMSVAKRQGYFIVYGSQLQFQRSYFGTVAVAKRIGGITREPVANCIYEGDEFVYTIDPSTGGIKIIKHDQKLENIDNTKIKGAYAILTRPDGTTEVTVMSMAQIQNAWNQGATKGGSPAHKNFAEEMAKKTVIGRACKMIINTSDDAWLYEGQRMDEEEERNETVREKGGSKSLAGYEEADYEEVTPAAGTAQEPAEEQKPETAASEQKPRTKAKPEVKQLEAPF